MTDAPDITTNGAPFRFDLREANGALGDLGTLLPLTLACIGLAGLSAVQVLMGFGLFYIATGLIYRLPIPVQPMKAIVAVALVAEVTPMSIALSGAVIGLVLIVLGTTGIIGRIGRLVPQSVLAGLQLGLGISLGWIAVKLMAGKPVIGLLSLGIAALAFRIGTYAALATLGFGVLASLVTGAPGLSLGTEAGIWMPQIPTLAETRIAIAELVLPQLALTLTNAILLTALVAGDSFGSQASHVTPRRLCLTSGIANLALAPFGALPMCHGAGGVAAHYRFGARSGGAPVMIGGALVLVALLPADLRSAGFAALPAATLGALLLIAAAELAINRRLFDSNPSCRPVIAAAALATVLVNPLAGLAAGTMAEMLRKAYLRRQRQQ